MISVKVSVLEHTMKMGAVVIFPDEDEQSGLDFSSVNSKNRNRRENNMGLRAGLDVVAKDQ
jgi:hypothetical protein